MTHTLPALQQALIPWQVADAGRDLLAIVVVLMDQYVPTWSASDVLHCALRPPRRGRQRWVRLRADGGPERECNGQWPRGMVSMHTGGMGHSRATPWIHHDSFFGFGIFQKRSKRIGTKD